MRARPKVLYEDPELGFQVLAHLNDKARVSPPHDHGASWAIYGQASKYTDMIEWKREDDGADPKHAKLEPAKKYRLEPGHAGIYEDGRSTRSTTPTAPCSCASPAPISTGSTASAMDNEVRRGAADDAAAGDIVECGARLILRASIPAQAGIEVGSYCRVPAIFDGLTSG